MIEAFWLALAALTAAFLAGVHLGRHASVQPAPVALPACRCGHPFDVHDHWRPGRDCGTCGQATCPTYRPETPR